ncbi:C6 zinc finger domain-containing protein [Verticillium dahliae VdLs.17]|uniref:C6 zinc finger domain-containing protein n=1 Tax=Verticillium dahliae (strain VdLs.17 / ATCC MYA-4575 / FGSC 10137) TaxID=498257 RepID=G2XDH2_VERDV|nr:C6 zinc finger domain-containing protein [Verticillium dahliae VdLs.17]EGY17040.1 C6 zinc finger domain-containing protein [Verticillium dahliae VdLs.17]KAH6696081.1 C6 zinc finger domain-containing protein [Verticillium dahliae]
MAPEPPPPSRLLLTSNETPICREPRDSAAATRLSNFQGTPTAECQPCSHYYPSTATLPPPKGTHMRLKPRMLHLRTIQLVFPVGPARLRMQQQLPIGPEALANGTVGRCQGLMSRIHEKERLQLVLSRLDRLPSSPGQGHGGLVAELSYAANSTPSNSVPLEPRRTTDEAPVEVQTISRDDLSIPSAKTTCEAVLQWPVLECCYPPNYIIDAVFETGIVDSDSDEEDEKESSNLSLLNKSRRHGFNEEDVLPLVQRFLDLVHTKNPVLEADTLWSYARRVAEDGLKWDSRSCMVLLACALGSVARSFPEGTSTPSPGATSSLKSQAESLHSGEVYYNLARRRFGLLQKGLLEPQCHFFAGVYLMYTLRPLLAWTQFHSASRSYHVYLQCQARRTNSLTSGSRSARRRQLEQRLYWSCYKSECELRAEMDLPNSSLASFNFPDMHPSPPDMDTPSSDPVDQTNPSAGQQPSVPSRLSASLILQQEESWYYYLTEITLRRIANDILNEFYQNGHEGWNTETIGFMAQAARGFEQQLSDWYELIG